MRRQYGPGPRLTALKLPILCDAVSFARARARHASRVVGGGSERDAEVPIQLLRTPARLTLRQVPQLLQQPIETQGYIQARRAHPRVSGADNHVFSASHEEKTENFSRGSELI